MRVICGFFRAQFIFGDKNYTYASEGKQRIEVLAGVKIKIEQEMKIKKKKLKKLANFFQIKFLRMKKVTRAFFWERGGEEGWIRIVVRKKQNKVREKGKKKWEGMHALLISWMSQNLI